MHSCSIRKSWAGRGGREGGRRGEAGRRLCYRSPEQRFPPTVIRLDDEQLQFHHICGRGPRHTSKAVHAWEPLSRLPGRAGRRTGEEVVLPRLLLLLLRGGGACCALRVLGSLLTARDPIIRAGDIDQSRATRRSETRIRSLALSLSLSLSSLSFLSLLPPASREKEGGGREREREGEREGGREEG